uniref:(northern house mosquito) hypothetical protein n=1 Tax=Culex pipiens TaxID=7175 RepID=A0A8D8MTA5_CULPI
MPVSFFSTYFSTSSLREMGATYGTRLDVFSAAVRFCFLYFLRNFRRTKPFCSASCACSLRKCRTKLPTLNAIWNSGQAVSLIIQWIPFSSTSTFSMTKRRNDFSSSGSGSSLSSPKNPFSLASSGCLKRK